MKSVHQQQVELLMSKIPGQAVPQVPLTPSEWVRRLRASLILEEALETIAALGMNVRILDDNSSMKDFAIMGRLSVEPSVGGPSLIAIADGCFDTHVVVTGTLSACGLPDVVGQDIVDRANLRKFGPGGRLREDGKWIKPPDFVGPERELEHWIESLITG